MKTEQVGKFTITLQPALRMGANWTVTIEPGNMKFISSTGEATYNKSTSFHEMDSDWAEARFKDFVNYASKETLQEEKEISEYWAFIRTRGSA